MYDRSDLRDVGFTGIGATYGMADVATCDGKPAVAMSWFEGALAGFEVHPNFRRRGIARALIQRLARVDPLEVYDPNEAMLRLLKRNGHVSQPDGRGVVIFSLSHPRHQVATLETELRAIYATAPCGPLKGNDLPPKPSPDDNLDFGEETLNFPERLAAWQSRADELAAQSNVAAAFAQVRAEFEFSEPGYRLILDDAHLHGGSAVTAVPSTFPWWVPDHLHRKKLFDRLLADLKPVSISYPSRANAHRQRALVHAILNEVDRLAGIDTSQIRAKIMRIYGPQNP
jgi:GNAT superfamily N-acetyltransferase